MIIYEALNPETGVVYVGATTKSLEERKRHHWYSHRRSNAPFQVALREYGFDTFEWYEVLSVSSKEKMWDMEKLCIGLYEEQQTYNASTGGANPAEGMRHTDQTKSICGKYAKRRWDGKRARDKYPSWVFDLPRYKDAKEYGVPKTTWYRERQRRSSS